MSESNSTITVELDGQFIDENEIDQYIEKTGCKVIFNNIRIAGETTHIWNCADQFLYHSYGDPDNTVMMKPIDEDFESNNCEYHNCTDKVCKCELIFEQILFDRVNA